MKGLFPISLFVVFAISSSFVLTSIASAEEKSVRARSAATIKDEHAGVRYYKQGDYEKAFAKLEGPAKSGFKQSQYLLGIMYLKGQFVPQSIVKGMCWLGVANEIDVPDWTRTYDSIHANLSTQQKKTVDEEIQHYIAKYGLVAQDMVCRKRAKLGSRRTETICNKRLGTGSPLMELENRAEPTLE